MSQEPTVIAILKSYTRTQRYVAVVTTLILLFLLADKLWWS